MRHHEKPIVGAWYQDLEFLSSFEVVASDDKDDCVEIQYFNGEIEEVDLETWYELDLSPIPAPDDWSGPYEMAKEDMGYTDDVLHPDDWSNPLEEIDSQAFRH